LGGGDAPPYIKQNNMALTTKMFVNYSKTKAEFIAAGLPSTYTNSIVFIKGDANGNGSCIYTHGMYFANFAELIAALNYVKGVNVGGQNYNAAAGGGYVAFEAADPSTVAVNAGSNGVKIGLTEAFVNKVNNTATSLGSASDAANKDGSAFARIANLAALVSDLTGGSTDSIEGQITAAINALRTEIVGTLGTDDAKTLEKINDELDSIISNASGVEARVKAIEDDYLTSADETSIISTLQGSSADGAASPTIAGAKKYTDALAQTAVKSNTEAIAVLNGNDTQVGSVAKQIKDAINEFAGSADSDNVIENVTELLKYVSGVDGSKTLAEAIAQIDENKGKIETLNGGNTTAGSVAKAVKDAIDAEVERADEAYATAAQGTKADSAVQKADITTGTTNGTIKVQGQAVSVYGLKSAAYTDSSDYATATQGTKADNALRAVDSVNANQAEVKVVNDVPTLALKVVAISELQSEAYIGASHTAAPLVTASAVNNYMKSSIEDAFGWEEL
jgi:hypothetical protein